MYKFQRAAAHRNELGWGAVGPWFDARKQIVYNIFPCDLKMAEVAVNNPLPAVAS